MNPVVVAMEMLTAYGPDTDAAWSGLLAGRSALATSDRIHFPAGASVSPLGMVSGIDPARPAAAQMLETLLARLRPVIPSDTLVLLATTTGEIELLEAAALGRPEVSSAEESDPSRLLERVCEMCGAIGGGLVISAACASSTVAVAQAASMIRAGTRDSVLVVACDAVSEFVYAGFATLNALDPAGARPFDVERRGLSLGEAAAAMLLMSEARAANEGRPVLGQIAGWSMSNDATHVTRPDTGGAQLARASQLAIAHSGIEPERIAFISAHGTGTRYNDAMEMAAFRSFSRRLPVFSVKGGIGHTLAAAGLIETIVSLRALAEGVVPPSPGLRQPDADAAGWASTETARLDGARAALTTNSGFGGINAALVLTLPESEQTHNGASFRAERGTSQTMPSVDCEFPRSARNDVRDCGTTVLANSPRFTTGIGWITSAAFGLVRHGETSGFSDGVSGRLLGSVDALFQHKIENFGRFDPVSRMTCCACALALRDAGIDYSPERKQEIGIIGTGFRGSLQANRDYFKDYVDAGRILARGNLFVYTLPSAPPGEAAIHFGFQGPLFSIITPASPLAVGLETARALLNDDAAPAMLVVQAEADCAVAAVVVPGSSCPLLAGLAQLSASHARLRDLIDTLSTTPVGGIQSCE